jgi:hypothetical protein
MLDRIESRCRCWRKSRLAARIALRGRLGTTNARDKRLAKILVKDIEVASYLVDQGFAVLCAEKGLNYHELVAR